MSSWRLFVGVDLPSFMKDEIGAWIRKQRAITTGWRWVRPENLHVTLRFLGDTPEDRVEPLQSSLDQITEDIPAAEIHLADLGYFPHSRRPRVMWIGFEDVTKVCELLARRAETWARAAGFEADERPFQSHITVARTPRDRRSETLRSPRVEFGTMSVETVTLYRSHLSPSGPRYDVLSTATLGGRS